MSRRYWWFYLVTIIGSTLAISRLEDTANRELDKVAGPVLKEIGVLVSELILSPLLLPVLLVCVLLIISFIRTMVMPLPPEVLTPQPNASKSRTIIHAGVRWDTHREIVRYFQTDESLEVLGPYCPSPSCLAELQVGGRTNSWCPNCETHYYVDGGVESARTIARTKFNAAILREREALSPAQQTEA